MRPPGAVRADLQAAGSEAQAPARQPPFSQDDQDTITPYRPEMANDLLLALSRLEAGTAAEPDEPTTPGQRLDALLRDFTRSLRSPREPPAPPIEPSGADLLRKLREREKYGEDD
jgi:hypothetical protein